MNESKVVILGGGMVAGYAAKQLVELGLRSGELAILSADNSVPYERPPLSKGFLAGKDAEEAIRINPEDFYRKRGIELKLECEIAAVDPKRKRLILKRGDEFGFDKLIVATGAHPRSLNIPGANLRNLYYLRTLDDSRVIRRALETVKHAVVIGGGFIDMEVAAVLTQKGVEVTMILNEDRMWKRLFSPEMSSFFEAYYTARRVRLIKSTAVSELRGGSCEFGGAWRWSDHSLRTGSCWHWSTAGHRDAREQRTRCRGRRQYLETNQPDVFAAGDIVNYQDVLLGKRRRVEHWDNAVSQGQYCARSLMGERIPFKHVPYFFSDVFDLSYEYWGDSSGADQIIYRGDFSNNSFSVWWFREQRIVAAFAMNRPDERDLAPRWIESGQTLSAAKLKDASQPIARAAE